MCKRQRREYTAAQQALARALEMVRHTGAGLFVVFVRLETVLTEESIGNTAAAVAAALRAERLLQEFGSTFHLERYLDEFSDTVRARLHQPRTRQP